MMNRLVAFLQSASQTAGLTTFLIGCVVMLGWIFDIPIIKSILPGLVTMKANTSLCFILSGAVLWLWHQRQKVQNPEFGVQRFVFAVLLLLMSAVVALIGLLTSIEYCLDIDFGIDQLLFKDSANAVGTFAPGRMAANTALNFLMLGGAQLLLLRVGSFSYSLPQLLSFAAFVVAWLGLLGYLYGISSFYGLGAYTRIALHTSVAFILLSMGLLCTHPSQGWMSVLTSNSAGGLMARRLSSAVILIPPILSWLVLIGYRAGYYSPEVGFAILGMINLVFFSVPIWWNARSLNTLDGKRWQAQMELQTLNAELEQRVRERTAQLEAANQLQDELLVREHAARQSAEASEQRYRFLIEAIPQLVWTTQPDGSCDYLNQRWVDYTGLTQEQAQDNQWASVLHPDDQQRTLAVWNQSLQTGQTYEVEFRLKRAADAQYRWYLSQGLPMRDHAGQIIKWFGTCTDIDDQKQAEYLLAQQAADLTRSNAELEQFAYVASHDLQEPLRMVASYTQLLARRYQGQLDADADDFIAFAVDGANRMQRLIKDLLAYSRVGTRGQEFQLTGCEIVLQEVLTNLQVAIAESSATVTHDPLPEVKGDPTQLAQLFQNLIENAIKFRGEAAPLIHISAQARDHEWLFSVRDNGLGIESDSADRIFIIFQRLHNWGAYPGTGIGLAICKKIVERHGGQIWVEGQLGLGSVFYFTISRTQESLR